jgi:hypothetical protein
MEVSSFASFDSKPLAAANATTADSDLPLVCA